MARTVVTFALVSALAAQDPSIPPGGFPIRQDRDVLVTFADGYKTRMDLRYPDPAQVPPPATGWPALLCFHWLFQNRSTVIEADLYARRGYVTIAYDVRGHGDTIALNTTGGWTFVGGPEKADMAEVLAAAEAQLGNVFDSNRLGSLGISLGGHHSWSAAAWSGRPMPQPRGAITHFPTMTAVAPQAGTAHLEALSHDGDAFNSILQFWVFGNASSLKFDPVIEQQMRQMFLNQDFVGYRNLLTNDPWRHDQQLIPTTSTAIMAHTSHDDGQFPVEDTAALINSLPATTPRMLYVSTGDHDAVLNDLEALHRNYLVERWFDHFMKQRPDEFRCREPFVLSRIEDDIAAHTSRTTALQLRQSRTYPGGTPATLASFYLRGNSTLSNTAPNTTEPPATVTHTVASGFGPNEYLATNNITTNVFAAVPWSFAPYRSAPLTVDTEMFGGMTADIWIESSAPNIQLNVALVDEDANGLLRYITGAAKAMRGRTPGRTNIVMPVHCPPYVFRAGHRVVILVENHVWHRPLWLDLLRTVPYFENYSFQVLTEPGAASRVDIDLMAPQLAARTTRFSLSQALGGTIPVPIRGDTGRAGNAYALLITASGQCPGLQIAGISIPANFDVWSNAGLLLSGTSVFSGFTGVLDSAGNANAAFALGANVLPPSFVGTRFGFAAVSIDSGGNWSASAASEATLTF